MKHLFVLMGFIMLVVSGCTTLGKHNIPQQNMQLVAIYYDAGWLLATSNNIYSEDAWNDVIQLAPLFAEAYHNRGVARAHLGRWEQALDDFDRALKINPDLALSVIGRNLANNKVDGKNVGGMDIPRTCKQFHKLYEQGC